MSSTPAGKSEFRQRAGGNVQHHQRAGSASSLPRPGASRPSPGGGGTTNRASPTGSPVIPKRAYSGVVPPMPPPYPVGQQRSTSFTSQTSSTQSGSYHDPRGSMASRSSSNAAYAGAAAAAASQIGGGGATAATGSYSGGYGSMNNNNAYSNGGMSSTTVQQSQQQRRTSDNKYNKPNNRRGSSASSPLGAGIGMMLGCLFLFCYSIIMTAMYFSNSGATSTLLKRLDQPDTLAVVTKVEDLERQLSQSEASRSRTERNTQSKSSSKINQLERELRLKNDELTKVTQIQLPPLQEKAEKVTLREKAFGDQIGWLMDTTRRESKRMVLERFGPGPHKVEMTFVVDVPAEDKDAEESLKKKHFTFIIELAPLDTVPHAIHLFLEQVDHGLMEGTSFYLNGPHIVQAGPQPKWDDYYDGTDDELFNNVAPDTKKKKEIISSAATDTLKKYENKLEETSKEELYDDDQYEHVVEDSKYEASRTQRYSELGLDQLAFPDYSAQYPHTPWTVGFTGRPGGPDWYINKVDNTAGHGPGGQYQYQLIEQGDSCFGIISAEGSGRNALAGYVFQGDNTADNSEWHHFLIAPVEIVSADIITKEPLLDHHLHLDENHPDSTKIYHNIPRKTEFGQEARKKMLERQERDRLQQEKLEAARAQQAAGAARAAAYQERGGGPGQGGQQALNNRQQLNENVKVGDGVDPNNIPQSVHDKLQDKGAYTINKMKNGLERNERRRHIPHPHDATEA